MPLGELEVAVLHEGLQGLDAGVLVLDAVDLLDGEVLADFGGLLPHDLGKVVLKLNRLDAELVEGLLVLPLQTAGRLDRVLNDFVRLALGDVGNHDVHVARRGVLRHGDDRRGVALAVLAEGGVVRRDEQEPRLGEVRGKLPVVVVVDPLLGKRAVLRVDGLVLDLAAEGRLALRYPHNHEGVVGELLLPQDGGSFQHRGLVRLEEVLGVLLVPGVLKVGEDALPGVPQGRVCREGDDALVADGLILGVLGDIGEEGVVVEQRSDVDDVRVGVARLAHGLIEPVPELLSLLGCVDVLVVLEVVAQDEVGPPLFVPPSADLLARAQRLDLDPVREEDDRRLPDAAHKLPEVLPERRVLLKLRFDVGEEALGLFRAVREDDLVVLVGVHRRVDGVLEGEVRALGVSTRGLDRPPASVRPADFLRVGGGVQPLHDALAEDAVELLVKRGRRPHKVVGEVGPPEVAQVNRPELPA